MLQIYFVSLNLIHLLSSAQCFIHIKNRERIFCAMASILFKEWQSPAPLQAEMQKIHLGLTHPHGKTWMGNGWEKNG